MMFETSERRGRDGWTEGLRDGGTEGRRDELTEEFFLRYRRTEERTDGSKGIHGRFFFFKDFNGI